MQVEFQCDNSFRLYGDKTINCDVSTGQWGQVPQCTCPVPKLRPSMRRIQTGDNNFAISCVSSLQLIGSSDLTCEQLNDPWNTPFCTCPLPVIDHVRILPINETTCNYHCNENLGLTGDRYLTCDVKSRTWSTPFWPL